MGKPKNSERFKSFDVMLPQGARSRHMKAMQALDQAEDLLPEDALDGNVSDITAALTQLATAQKNLSEMLAYRKMLGID